MEFATQEIGRRRWRGRRGGVVPEGYDAEGIANQVIAEMLAGKCRLVVGFTRERVVNELKRLVDRRVRVLHRLNEAGAVRSEWEGVVGEDGKGESLLRDVRDEGESAEEAVCRQEEESWRKRVVEGFEELVDREPELRGIFGCLCAGMIESKEIARQLGMDEAGVVKGRKKLVRRAGAYERKLKGKGRTTDAR